MLYKHIIGYVNNSQILNTNIYFLHLFIEYSYFKICLSQTYLEDLVKTARIYNSSTADFSSCARNSWFVAILFYPEHSPFLFTTNYSIHKKILLQIYKAVFTLIRRLDNMSWSCINVHHKPNSFSSFFTQQNLNRIDLFWSTN